MKWFVADGELYRCSDKVWKKYATPIEEMSMIEMDFVGDGDWASKLCDLVEHSTFVRLLDGGWNS